MNDTGAKQQIVDKIKNSSNILVTVSSSPSVDELSAALGLTLLLNKLNKHATAVFSGAVPPAITFLDPGKTFEDTVNSLRDFIIALDKEKADHLRYKVDGEVVKIFITPYRTTLDSSDLDFSQGDYNVELVLALGVEQRDNLDQALSAHGRILHDATVATISVGSKSSQLGSIDWRDENASSFSEMLVSISDALKKDKPILDEQIATAFLTGIVAATDRFSNDRTSSRVMTMAAQLMAAGANQQLIAAKLEEANEIGAEKSSNDSDDQSNDIDQNSDGTTDLSEGESTKLNNNQSKRSRNKKKKPAEKDGGSLVISHEPVGDVDEVAAVTAEEQQQAAAEEAEAKLRQQQTQTQAEPAPQASEPSLNAQEQAEQVLSQQLSAVAPAASADTPSVADLQKDLAAASADVEEAAAQPVIEPSGASPFIGRATQPAGAQEPILGGTLNATTEQAAEEARRAEESDRNRAILSHSKTSYVGDNKPIFDSPLNAATAPPPEEVMHDPFATTSGPSGVTVNSPLTIQPPEPTPAPSIPSPAPFPAPAQTLADIDRENRQTDPHAEARQAVDAAFGAVPFTPAGNPTAGVGAQPLGGDIHQEPAPSAESPQTDLPPLPDFSTLPPLPPAAPQLQSSTPTPDLPPDKLEDMLSPAAPPPTAPQSDDPAQFKIPGQP